MNTFLLSKHFNMPVALTMMTMIMRRPIGGLWAWLTRWNCRNFTVRFSKITDEVWQFLLSSDVFSTKLIIRSLKSYLLIMNFEDLQEKVKEGCYLRSLYFQQSSRRTTGTYYSDYFLDMIKTPFHNRASARFDELENIAGHILEYLLFDYTPYEHVGRKFQPFPEGCNVKRIFVSGGCASYLLGR